MLWPHQPDWPGAVVPIAINVLQYPLPTAMRCYKLGQAVRRAIESYPEDLRVVVVGTGGLSHQIHGERTGFNNTDWDMRFLDLIERDPLKLARMRHAEYVELGGAEGVEVIMWLAMRGALSRRHPQAASELLPADDDGDDGDAVRGAAGAGARSDAAHERGAARMNPQLEGIEEVAGTYPFDLATSVRTLRINRFFWQHDRARASRALRCATRQGAVRGGGPDARRSATWCAAATGSG